MLMVIDCTCKFDSIKYIEKYLKLITKYHLIEYCVTPQKKKKKKTQLSVEYTRISEVSH